MKHKESPISFKTPLVQATLRGEKTITRRLNDLHVINKNPDDWFLNSAVVRRGQTVAIFDNKTSSMTLEIKCRFGAPMHLLYVRESWAIKSSPLDASEAIRLNWKGCNQIDEILYKASPRIGLRHVHGNNAHHFDNMTYLDESTEMNYHPLGWPQKWKPSIHMKKMYARLWLQVVNIRVERLQDISEDDAIAEGIDREWCSETVPETGQDASGWGYRDYSDPSGLTFEESPIYSFLTLWQSINEKRGFSWFTNPWVWVVEFHKTEAPGRSV